MIPVWTLCLFLGFSVTNSLRTDAKYTAKPAKPVLTLLVRDLVGIDPTTRNIARAQAIGILNKAGVELRWIDANGFEDPHLPSKLKHYTVVVAAEPFSGWNSRDAMGFAPDRTGPFPRAYVFTGLINAFLKNFTIQYKAAFAVILGHTIVHELGHLVIPGRAHGYGIMRPRWGYIELREALEGSLLFEPSQAQLLRQTLQKFN